MGALYDDDIVLWSEAQAALLRRLAAGERVNDALDFENLIEEVESVGRSQYHGVARHLRVALTHLLLAQRAPGAIWVGHWLIEAQAALDDAEQAYAPSMACTNAPCKPLISFGLQRSKAYSFTNSRGLRRKPALRKPAD